MLMLQLSSSVTIWKQPMDIRPPIKRQQKPNQSASGVLPSVVSTPVTESSSPQLSSAKNRWWALVLAGAGLLLVAASISSAIWYNWAIGARSTETNTIRIVVRSGDTATSIADTLYDHELIRSRLAFNIYTQLSGMRSKLQAGGYVLSPDQTVSSIVEHMVSGKTDEFDVTILPGLTLEELRTRFKADGFSDQEITTAYQADYNHPLLATKPDGASLEGYIYPETYRMNADQSLEVLFERVFDEMYETLQDKKYLEEFAKRNLSIHEGITLASIIQKEVTDPVDQKQVAQVFLKRLADGMQLGSDVTYLYAAKQRGIEGTPALESPYNTRKYTGLPPGPIANMNPSALEAVAFPAAGDFVYFVAGDGQDEGKTFFAHTFEEHEANIAAHCRELCR